MTLDPPTILVVDDDKMIAGFLEDLLSEAGYAVRVAHSGQAALDVLASAEPGAIDLVLLDVILPDVDGYTICRRLRSSPRTERLLIIMVTGRDKPTEKTQGLELGADDYIAKPFDPHELLARVRSMLRLHRAEQDLWARNRALAVLNAVSQTIGRAIELPDVLGSALDQVLAALELQAGIITLQSPDGHQTIAIQRWPPGDLAPNILIAEQVAQTAQPALFEHGACVPLISRNRVLGTLYVIGQREIGSPALDDLLPTIGNQIGAAIERARLYEEAQQRSEDLAVLNEITRAVTSSLELDRVLTTSLHSIRQILRVEAGSLILVDAESSEMHFRNTLQTLEAWLRQDAAQAGGGIIGMLNVTREPVILKDLSAFNTSDFTGLALRNLLAVPLIAQSRMIGAIVVVNRTEGAFTRDDLELLQFLGGAVAVAAENARLYGELADFARELERSQAQLIQAEKLAATGRLAASLAHEINNPLQAIHNCLHLVVDRQLPSERKNYYLGLAQNEVERLMTLVQHMLDFYRPSQGRAVATQVNRLVENVLALSDKRLAHGQIRVDTRLQSDLPLIAAVPDQLTQVLLNLTINAVEAMPEGGTLTITTAASDSGLEIVVHDTGTGLTPDEAAKVFEPFYTTKTHGTGLGLAVSYGIIQQHGGRLEIDSTPGAGSTFTVWLPLNQSFDDD